MDTSITPLISLEIVLWISSYTYPINISILPLATTTVTPLLRMALE
jgi:hypothetical protein